MIDSRTIQELLDKEPFEAFRIRMSDGNDYEVTNPSLAVTMVKTLFLAMPKRDHFKMLSYENMASIESSDVRA